MKLATAFAIALAGTAGVTSAEAAFEPSLPFPYFEDSGGGFACVTNRELFEWAQSLPDAVGDTACMRFGPVYVAMPQEEVAAILGMADFGDVKDGRNFEVFGLAADDAGYAVTYVVVTYHVNGRVGALQLTGQPWPDTWQFSGVTLGSSVDAVRARFGEPFQTAPSDQPDTFQWSYHPWTFSFEISNGRVTSIRVADF